MERWNSEGIPRDQLMFILRQGFAVKTAIRIQKCMLCRASGVNEAGICHMCMAFLSDEESRLVEKFMNGMEPKEL